MVISRLPNMACIMKVDIVDNVFLGAGARLAGYIRNDAQLSMIRQSVAELKSGSQLLIFPEGTRTTRWPVNACKGTAALIASRAWCRSRPCSSDRLRPTSAGWPLFVARRCRSPTASARLPSCRRKRPTYRGVERYFIDELRDARTSCRPTPGAESVRSALMALDRKVSVITRGRASTKRCAPPVPGGRRCGWWWTAH
jgi:hypothetical protein